MIRRAPAPALLIVLIAGALLRSPAAAEEIVGSATTYRPAVVGRVGVVAAGRNFAAEAGLRMLNRGGNAVDAGVAATFAAAVTEISHFGLGGEVPILIYRADRREVAVINGQGVAPRAASAEFFRRQGHIPTNGPAAGAVPAVVDALAIALAEFGTLSLADTLAPAVQLAEDGFPWYELLTRFLSREIENVRSMPSGARVYLQGPGGTIPEIGSVFRQRELARTLRRLVDEERRHRRQGRKAAIYAARDRFYRGDIGQHIARAVQDAGGLLTAEDLARYRGRIERPTDVVFRAPYGTFDVFKTGFWGQGPVLLQTLLILQGFDLARMGHNSADYIHTVTEALKLTFADRDAYYADPDFARVPAADLLSEAYAAERRTLIDPAVANNAVRPGDPRTFGSRSTAVERLPAGRRDGVPPLAVAVGAEPASKPSADTTTVNVADARGNLFSASPSSAWFVGGAFIAGDTGVPLGNRMQAFVLDEAHPNVVQGGKRPRTTLTPTIVLRNGKPFIALSSPGGDNQEQHVLQVLLNIAVFRMRPQAAVEAPRFNSLHYHDSFGTHSLRMAGGLLVEDRIAATVISELRLRGHHVVPVGAFAVDSGVAVAGFEADQLTTFGAADVRRERFAVGW